MDGYGEFFWDVAPIAGVMALLAGAVVRLPIIMVIAGAVAATFCGIFIYLLWFTGADLVTGAMIDGVTVAFLCPAIVIPALLGKGFAKLVQEKG